MSKYDRIADYLDRQNVDRLQVRFSDLERALGGPLPASARKHQAWWANQTTGPHVNAIAWGRRGWRTSALDIGGERVTFIRDRDRKVSRKPINTEGFMIPRRLLTEASLRALDAAGDEAIERAAEALNETLGSRRKGLISRIMQAAPRVSGDSADLIRQDRDGR